MSTENRLAVLSGATFCTTGLMVFSFFIHYEFPVRIIAFVSLLIPAIIISRNIRSPEELKKIAGENLSYKKILSNIALGITAGTGLAIFYRWHLDISLFPRSFHFFVITAAIIGSMEELVFRGFIQEYVKSINGPFSILFSTLSHTGYKCCLFLSPVIAGNVDTGFLAIWTFGAGLLFGTIRHFTRSLLPSLVAHAIFDILVYAEYTGAPWWVW